MQKLITNLRSLLIASLLLGLSACGFSLRQAPPIPDDIAGVAIVAPSIQSKLARALSKRLSVYQIEQLDLNQENAVVISLSPEDLERRLLSVFSTGQVAEYELIYSVNYTVTFPGDEPIAGYMEVLREYQDDPDQILAKNRELELVLSEMRLDAADRIIRLLPSQSAL